MIERKLEFHHGTHAGWAHCSKRPGGACDSCKRAKAAYDKRNRAIPENTRKARLHAEAQRLALRALMAMHPDEYDALYEAYKRDVFGEAGLPVPKRNDKRSLEVKMPRGWVKVDE